jgi:dTDP-glucose 4,6-dehydratase
MICQSLQVDFNEVCEVSADRMGKDAAYLLDTDKINKELGWQDKVSLEQGIEQCVKWARDNFAVLRSQSLNYIHKV